MHSRQKLTWMVWPLGPQRLVERVVVERWKQQRSCHPASVQFFHPPLLALTTDLPGPADGPLNIVQGNILASWSQNQNPFRISEGDESDGNLGVLIRTLGWYEVLVGNCHLLMQLSRPRQGDDGYIIDRRYHISQIPFASFWRLL